VPIFPGFDNYRQIDKPAIVAKGHGIGTLEAPMPRKKKRYKSRILLHNFLLFSI
jgi:hypothetical protein